MIPPPQQKKTGYYILHAKGVSSHVPGPVHCSGSVVSSPLDELCIDFWITAVINHLVGGGDLLYAGIGDKWGSGG